MPGTIAEFYETADEFYETERSSNVYSGNPITINAYIGLIYPSDLLYSRIPKIPGPGVDLSVYNWIARKSYWFISSSSVDNRSVLMYGYDGYMHAIWEEYANENSQYFARDDAPNVHPTLYLKSITNIISGDGSQENPYRIA